MGGVDIIACSTVLRQRSRRFRGSAVRILLGLVFRYDNTERRKEEVKK